MKYFQLQAVSAHVGEFYLFSNKFDLLEIQSDEIRLVRRGVLNVV